MRLPPLNALRAFEAAARHGSFARAADELHVTQGAVSRHVKLLEEHLDVTLFRRLPRGLEPTAAAYKLLPKITASFDMIQQAANEVAGSRRGFKFLAPVTFANRWLMPRLARFKQRHPDIPVDFGISETIYDAFYRGDFDVAIVCYEGDQERPADLDGVLLRREILTAVCAPTLLHGDPPLEKPSDLTRHLLLHPFTEPYDWRKWLDAAGLLGTIDHRQGQTFSTMEMAVRAAMGGLGVAIADLHFFSEELVSGRLVVPFELAVSKNTGYYLVCRRGGFAEPQIAAFRDWLLAEVASDEKAIAPRRGTQHPAAQVSV